MNKEHKYKQCATAVIHRQHEAMHMSPEHNEDCIMIQGFKYANAQTQMNNNRDEHMRMDKAQIKSSYKLQTQNKHDTKLQTQMQNGVNATW